MGVEGRRNGYHYPNIDYKEITGIAPDTIYVTSGGVQVKSPEKEGIDRLATTSFHSEDPRGLLSWGKARVHAAAVLGQWFPQAGIVTMTTSSNTPEGYSDAAIAEHELLKLRVINPVATLPRSIDTHTEMLLATHHAVETQQPRMLIVVGGFQEDRAKAMLDSVLSGSDDATIRRVISTYHQRYPHRAADAEYYEQVLANLRVKKSTVSRLRPEFIHAETVLQYHPRYRTIANQAVIHPRYIAKAVQDSVGASEWRDGIYLDPHRSSMIKGR